MMAPLGGNRRRAGMRLTMGEKRVVTKALAQEYRRASKKGKGELLTQVTAATGYNRVYAARVLRGHGLRVEVGPGIVLEGAATPRRRRGARTRTYGPELVKALVKVWRVMDYLCGKRLRAALPEVVPVLVRQGELRVSREVRRQLMTVSAATIDRLLGPERAKAQVRGRSLTKPGTLLRHQIPVRTFADWDDVRPGFVEVDLVGHEGGVSRGDFCQTLDVTDVATSWCEQVAVPTRAQCWVFQALEEVRGRLPFALLGLDSDNGGEFINRHLERYCVQEGITFTRIRPGRKNDNCYVEQKNWSVVRRYAGYARFDTRAACQALNDLYRVVREYVNFFLPSMKLVQKTRDGARVTRVYDVPQTPYARVLASPLVEESVKASLRARYAQLNPAALHREMVRQQKRLNGLSSRCPAGQVAPHPADDHPWRHAGTTPRAQGASR